MQRKDSFSSIYLSIWLWVWAGKCPCLMVWDLGYSLWPALMVMRNDYICVYNRQLWISSRDVCIICDSQWAVLPNTKELCFSIVVTVLVGKQFSLLTHPLFDHSQWLHNMFRSVFFFWWGGSWLRHMALEESSQNPKTLRGFKETNFPLAFLQRGLCLNYLRKILVSPSVFKN